ncbi:DNA-processing protein DprA [Dactylosporangium sp. CS-047395]|uniref:DNA-processing protein DprA n=1 Tax=Dactylosporangium sp. CS-047395 TaxID=3239936 RepID=UPI003D8D4655
MTAGEDRTARAMLSWLTEPGDDTIGQLVSQHGAAAALDRLVADVSAAARVRPEVAPLPGPLRQLAESGAAAALATCRIVVPGDADWPAGLDDLARTGGRPPVCLWVRGPGRPPAPAVTVTVAGTRAASDYGRIVAMDMAAGLAAAGFTVVSSGRAGIDAAALRAALAVPQPGAPVALLPYGLHRLHPAAELRMLEQVADTGLLMSAWPPDAQPSPSRTVVNRTLLAAVSAGSVVVEARGGHGSVTVARRAADLGRTAMVVPGPVTAATSAGVHRLLRGDPRVRAVTSVTDIVSELRVAGPRVSMRALPAAGEVRPGPSPT